MVTEALTRHRRTRSHEESDEGLFGRRSPRGDLKAFLQ
jgi:hypothetical protein